MRALLLNAINPTVGGVLIKGPSGTGKSTAVRGLAELLPGDRGGGRLSVLLLTRTILARSCAERLAAARSCR